LFTISTAAKYKPTYSEHIYQYMPKPGRITDVNLLSTVLIVNLSKSEEH